MLAGGGAGKTFLPHSRYAKDGLESANLRLAVRKALRGKRHRRDAQDFLHNLHGNLASMQEELSSGTLRLGNYQQFAIFDPKCRTITAPSFREHVLHHAIMNVCEPVFERWLIADTYACRIGKGRLACIDRAAEFASSHGYFLKMDVRKYFDSIPHDVLLQHLCLRFKDAELLRLFQQILDGYRVTERRGLPIGALTSQHLANFYLGTLDRYLKETFLIRGYVRYMDDFVVWGDESRALKRLQATVGEFLVRELSLDLRRKVGRRRPRPE